MKDARDGPGPSPIVKRDSRAGLVRLLFFFFFLGEDADGRDVL